MMVLIDTNGLVASFLVRRPDSPVARIVRGMLEGRFPFLLSVELLAEYRSVLLRSAIRKRHSLSEEDVDSFLEEVAFLGVVREPRTLCDSAPDAGDNHLWHLWQLLKAQPGSVLVTGDLTLQEYPPEFASVLSPGTFCRQFGL